MDTVKIEIYRLPKETFQSELDDDEIWDITYPIFSVMTVGSYVPSIY